MYMKKVIFLLICMCMAFAVQAETGTGENLSPAVMDIIPKAMRRLKRLLMTKVMVNSDGRTKDLKLIYRPILTSFLR